MPGYLWRFRKAGQFATGRGTPEMAATPDLIAAEPMGPARSTIRAMPRARPSASSRRGAGPAPGVRWGKRQ